MSEETRPHDGSGGRAAREEEGVVRRLLQEAGPRPTVPEEDLQAIKAAFRAEWEARLRPRRRDRFPQRWLALAAALAAAVGIAGWWWSLRSPAGPAPVARAVRVTGEVLLETAAAAGGAPTARLAEGEPLPAGAELDIRDGAGTVALELGKGPSVRIDSGSRVRLASASVVHLERGAVYVDSGSAPRGARALEVRTPLGLVTDVGTRFEVRLLEAGDGALRVRVREGEVRIARGEEAHSAGAGAEVTLDADGTVTRRPVAAHGAPWRWTLEAAPRFDVEGRSLREFLDWVGRETGWEIRYADASIAAEADSIVLHGTLGELTPDQAPAVVLPGAGLRPAVEGGVLIVSAGDR